MDNHQSKVLIVDDKPSNLRFLSKILIERGYKVQRAISGKLALNGAMDAPPDLILLDIIMPQMDGYEVCQRLKANPETREIPVIFLSALNEALDKVKAFEVGGIDYITKPFHTEEVLVRIEKQLTIQRLSQQLKSQNTRLQQEIEVRQQAEAQLQQKSQALANFSSNLKQLHRLNTSSYNTFENLFADYLQTGSEILGFSTGVISQIDNQTYTIRSVKSDLEHLEPNQEFNLKETYCEAVVRTRQTVAYAQVEQLAQMQMHPVYRNFKLQSYIGTPIFVNGDIYGTLNFSSTQVRRQNFTAQDKEFIELMAQSLGRVIATYQAQMKRQQAEELLRRQLVAVESAMDGMATLNSTGEYLYLNEAHVKLFGYDTSSELVGKTWRELYDPEEIARFEQDIFPLLLASGQWRGEAIAKKRDGSTFFEEISLTLTEDGGLICVCRDITERKQAENDLRVVTEHLTSLLISSPASIYSCQISGDYRSTWVSDNVTSLTGYEAREFLEKSHFWLSHIHPEDVERVLEEFSHMFEQGCDCIEYRFLHKDGTYRWMYDELKLVYDEAGKPFEAVGYWIDITKRKQAEIELATAKVALERQIQQALLLSKITQEIRSSLNPEQIFQTAAAQIGQAFGVNRCLIHTYIENPTPCLPLVAEYKQSDLTSVLSMEIPVVGNPHAELVLTQDSCVASDDVYADSSLEAAISLCHQLGLKSMLAVRTSYQGKPNGIIGLHQYDRFRHWTDEEITLLEALAAQLGIAIAQANLLEQETQRRIELDQQNQQLQQEIRVRQQTEEALRKSEQRWQLILNANNDGIWDWNIITGEAFFSTRYKEMLGYKDSDLWHHVDEWRNLLHPDDFDRVRDCWQAYLDRKLPHYLIEYRLRCQDGSYKWTLARGQAQWDEVGKPVRMVGSCQDISDRKQAEERLRGQQQRLSFLVQNTPLAVIEWNTQREIVAWNQAAESIFGYSATEVLDRRGWKLLVPKSKRATASVKRLYEQLLTQQGGHYRILENLTKSGRTVICEWYNTRLIDEHGSVVGFASMAVDITERQHRELLQKAQNTILKMVAQGRSLQDVLLELTKQIDELTPKLYSSILLMEEDGKHLRPCVGPKIPRSWVQLIDPVPVGPNVGACGTAAYFGKRVIVEDVAADPLLVDSKEQALSHGFRACWSEPIVSDTGKVLGTFSMYFHEVRSPDSRELEVIESLARLAALIIQHKQAEVDLQQALDAAKAANCAKSDFLASMSHELRTPLNAILGFSQILTRDDSLTSKHREHIEIINRSGEHLLTLINDVLSMSKIEARRVTLDETRFNLHELLNSVEQMLQLKANSKGLQLTFELPKDIPQYVQTDESKLRQVLINLLGNAIKFTQEGRIVLRVSVVSDQWPVVSSNQQRTTDNGQLTLLFEVEDTGQGIAADEISTLFDPFVQTQIGRQSMEGTGLGLPISQEFVRLMGGDITVSSTLGQGSIFTFDIQVSVVTMADVETRVLQQRVIGLEPNQPTYRILVVEDVAENRQVLVNMLESLGFKIREAVNGQEAVVLWQSWQPHLILMDIRMPVMDGYEATKAIKLMPNGKDTVIMALTASAFDEQREAILSAGCDDFISKPFRAEILLAKISDRLGIRYIYGEDLPSTSSQWSEQPVTLSTDALKGMPSEWIEQLHNVALTMDEQPVLELIKQIPDTQATLANVLANLVHNFRLDLIADCTGKVMGNG